VSGKSKPHKTPAYQFYAKEWLVDTARLPLDVQGAYLRLLCHQWEEGSIPGDDGELARMLSLSAARFRKVWSKLEGFFPATTDGRANPKLEEVRASQIDLRGRLVAYGLKGAEARWKANGQANGGAMAEVGHAPVPVPVSERQASSTYPPSQAPRAVTGHGTQRRRPFSRENENNELPGLRRHRDGEQGMHAIAAILPRVVPS
jgi:uncharacterized protein YdaU (DUF1376 family)